MQSQWLQTSIEYLKGIGPQRAATIRKELGVATFADLLYLFPYRYLDRTKYYKINEINPQSTAEIQVIGKIISVQEIKQKRGSRLVATFSDGQQTMELIWFRGIKWVKEKLQPHTVYVAFSKVSSFNGKLSMAHPDLETLDEHQQKHYSTLQPVYPSTETLQKNYISSGIIARAVQQILVEVHSEIQESLSEDVMKKYQLMGRKQAVEAIHFPKDAHQLQQATFRLKFEELFFLQMQLLQSNVEHKQRIKGFPFEKVGDYFTTFYEKYLPFELTNAQKRVLKEIRLDVKKPVQMNRLLQGDVGSGKTIVAFMSMLMALDNDFQACLMAPTEILATQHYHGISELAEKIDVRVALLTGSTKTKERRKIHQGLENGEIQIIIGTHALIEDKVVFKNLGMAIIDEQHRFGVEQRAKLWRKNTLPPHILVMTATPIPRTLAMSLYGDLDISVIDELPPGRKPIETYHFFENKRLQVLHFIRKEIEKGRQVYVVYPLIQESETLDYKNLMEGYESLRRDFPEPEYLVSVVHGQMPAQEKEYEMQRFLERKTQIMVATTVIEVGVNVPNASVMIIESAERFGLSQLHQLRGRVGRGAEQSYCILMTGNKISNDTKIRLQAMCRTNDGFELSEVDLKLRGPGDLMGKQQSGMINFKIADLVKDQEILKWARAAATAVLKEDINLSMEKNQGIRNYLEQLKTKKTIWNYIS